MSLKEVKEIIKLIQDTDIEEIELERKGFRVRLRKKGSSGTPIFYPLPPPGQLATTPAPKALEVVAKGGDNLITIESPMVGTFYRAPAPGAEPYVREGDMVEKGTVLCIIEAMKLMNEIEAEIKGRIISILVENAQPVEYGKALFLLEPL
ncbi:MAG: acetyl-CoA carboxylase biotin carboxyl carrier protein [candidate division NC10 bacterium]|nr:acetyl-CoA carboxylase biotin carboxyl carrier protein [candidate division NC10 bacterium]